MKKTLPIIAACALCVLGLALVAVPALADAALPDPIDVVEETFESYMGIIAAAVAVAILAVVSIFKKKKQ